MGGQHLAQGLGGEQWDVAVGDDDGAGQLGGKGSQAALDGAAGALDLVLIGDEAVGVALGDVGSDEVTFVPHDDLKVDGVDASGLSLIHICPALVPRDLTGVDVLTHLTLTFPLWQSTLAAVNGSLWSIPLEATLYLCLLYTSRCV